MQIILLLSVIAAALLQGSSADPSSPDLTSHCGGYCFNAFKPMFDLMGNTQTAKLIETQEKLASLEAQLVELKEKLSDSEASLKFETSVTTRINPRGFVKIKSRFFYIEDRFRLNFYSALIMCRQMGAYLAVIRNEEELTAFEEELNARHKYWLDISRLTNDSEQKYSSLSSGKDVTFLKWAHNEPRDYFQTEACVTIFNSTMTTEPCGDGFYFICEAIE
ncbi:C-type lectin 37Db-like [Drosophila kikkawai]|uniref:C-type lectin 37Db-like n=1 Tax=Drosophila kikkawai TaxID=30033 RepID=A0ABM3C6M7_DROKI|nr:C-type lectin 37Db-like [Drosophila kikkawai]